MWARAVREWAKARGYKISERGRIPANNMTEFQNAEAKYADIPARALPPSRPGLAACGRSLTARTIRHGLWPRYLPGCS